MPKLWNLNDKAECFVPDTRRLPQPLVHMLANSPQYFSICDNYLRGYSGFDWTRMFGEFDGPNFPKNNGRFLWIRPEKGEPWLPNNPDTSLCESDEISFRMGLGYVKFKNLSKKLGLCVEATVFVPLEDMNEIWIVEITNVSNKKRKIDFIPTVPIFGGSRAYTEYHRDVVRLYNKSRVTDHIEIFPGLEWVEGKTDSSDICYYMSAETENGRRGDCFYSDRESFLGANYSWLKPQSIFENKPPRFHCLGKEAVGAIEFRNICLAPKKTARFLVLSGISHNQKRAQKKIVKYDFKGALGAFDELQNFWKERVSRVSIETGSAELNHSWNNWWCYQLSMRYWFGNTGHPQFDYGSDFAGWRDFWQDMMAATVIDPEDIEKKTLHSLEGIRFDGTNATRFFARTKEFGSDEINGQWCDHPYWTAQTVLILANSLGDADFLFKDGIAYFKDCYRDRGEKKDISWPAGHIEKQKTKTGQVYTGTVIEHLLVQLMTMFYDVGANNLLKQKRADWNDAVDQVKGENVTFSMGISHDLRELADFLENAAKRTGRKEIEIFEELSDLIENWDGKPVENLPVSLKQEKLSKFLYKVNANISGKKLNIKISDLTRDMKNKADVIIDTVNKLAFNGEYYTGYLYADGKPVDGIFANGTMRKSKPTTDDFVIMLMPQTWSLLSGAADKIGAVNKVLNSVNKLLYDKEVHALKLNYPAYWKFDNKVGRITGFAAGTKENNAIFCHANLFLVWALLRRRMADEAYRIFSGINPLSHKQEILRTGPWIPEYYVSSDNPNWPGRGEYPMLTASAGWTRFIFQNFFFGVRGEVDGLRIAPCLPSAAEFKKSKLTIHFRGAVYEITFNNPKLKKNSVPLSISIDGKKIEGTLIKPFSAGTHKVEVFLDSPQK